jgi:hypothetical protein
VQLDRDLYAGDVGTVALDCDPALVADDMKVHVKGSTVLMARSEDEWASRPVQDVLVTCLRYVEDHVVSKFKPFFAQS